MKHVIRKIGLLRHHSQGGNRMKKAVQNRQFEDIQLISLVHDQLLSVSEGARRMNMTEEEFRTLL